MLQLQKAQESGESGSGTDEGASDAELEGERSTTACQGGLTLLGPGVIGQQVAKYFRGHGWHAGKVGNTDGGGVAVRFDDGTVVECAVNDIPSMQADYNKHGDNCFQEGRR
jgi:hypothetical protein